MVDGYGLPVEFEVIGGNVNDCSVAPELIAKLPDTQAIVADKDYESECIRKQIVKKGTRAVIPIKSVTRLRATQTWIGGYINKISAFGGKTPLPD